MNWQEALAQHGGELREDGEGGAERAGRMAQDGLGRPFVGIHFACCNVYQRIYLNRESTAYVGWCPKCAGRAEVRVSPDGTEERFFTAS